MTTKADTDRDNLRQVSDSLRSLGANLIGVVRGAGNPLELSRGLDAFIAALGAFEGATGRHPRARELAEMLRVDLEPKSSTPTSEEELAELYAQHAVVQASLRLAAARLLRHEVEASEAYVDLHKALWGLDETKRRIERRRDDADAHIAAKMDVRKKLD
jgi:hypothetical protein